MKQKGHLWTTIITESFFPAILRSVTAKRHWTHSYTRDTTVIAILCRNHTGFMGAGTPMNIVVSRAALLPCVVFHTNLDRTKLLCKNWCTKLLCRNWRCRASFCCQQTSFCSKCFSWFRGKYIIESDVCQWLVLVSFIQNHSEITQLFYVMTSSRQKPLVHDLLCSKMLPELLHRTEK